MQYQELYNRYNELLNQKFIHESNLATLANGYISTKTISGNKYYYLQKKNKGKVKSEYIKAELLDNIESQLEVRKQTEKEIDNINAELDKIEAASAILNLGLLQKIEILKQSSQMDILPLSNRKNALSFAEAMTAIEGIPASNDTNANLSKWADGLMSFKDIYIQTLEKYNMIEV